MPNLGTTSTAQLLAEAQAAYEQKRLRECIALTKELILADPSNSEAQALQQAIREDIRQDVHDARTLLEQSGTPEEKKKYRKASEIILTKTLQLDPENEEAKALLQSARAVPGLQPPSPPPQQHQQPSRAKEDARTREELSFTAAPALFKSLETKPKKKGLKLPLGLILALLGGGAVLKFVQSHQSNPTTLAATNSRTDSLPASLRPVSANSSNTASSIPPAQTTPASASLTVAGGQTPAVAPAVSQVPSTLTTPAPAAQPAMGNLAVSSPTAAEIYQAGKYVGSTPTTLQLPAGKQTLEYRHGDLRTVVNHDIKGNETTTASVTFQINVQINAKPWAQVFLEGGQRRPLGQTPLSSVSVPIGGVLLFENPGFASKTYRITEKDTAIQVDFQ
jgi:hypothetical protein